MLSTIDDAFLTDNVPHKQTIKELYKEVQLMDISLAITSGIMSICVITLTYLVIKIVKFNDKILVLMLITLNLTILAYLVTNIYEAIAI